MGGRGMENGRERVEYTAPSARRGATAREERGGEARSLDPAALERYRDKRGFASGRA
jgi:hypothetical protein